MQLILLGILAWRNGVRAKLKELNAIAWGLYTVIAYLSSLVIGTMVVVFGFCRNVIDFNMMSSTDAKVREEASKMLAKVVLDNPLHSLTIMAFGVGGYLLVRYIIDRKPGKKLPEVHWMDKMGE